METTKTISVEPGKITLADKINSERKNDIFRTTIYDSYLEPKRRNIIFDLVLPSTKTATLALNKYMIPLRSIFSALTIVFGINSIVSGTVGGSITIGVLAIVFGSFLAIGCLTRIIMAAASVMFLSLGIISMREGMADLCNFCMMFGSLVFMLNGAGKYSLDTILRRQIKRYSAKRIFKAKEERLSYKAFKLM